jgi:AcrR family transcriptional regulator
MKSSISNDASIETAEDGVSSALNKQLLTRPGTEPSDRQARRRRQTRARLVRAASGLFARQGVDNTRINEITDEADVGFGSFYNHFKSKEEIVEAVLTETLAAQGAAVAALTAGLEDPAEVVAVAHRHFVDLARSDPDWAWLLIRLDLSQKLALGALGPFAEQDIAAGVKAGRFRVANRRIAMLDAGGGLLAVMREVLDGRAPKDAGRLHAEDVLRLLGLKPDDAAEVARRPMPGVSKKA